VRAAANDSEGKAAIKKGKIRLRTIAFAGKGGNREGEMCQMKIELCSTQVPNRTRTASGKKAFERRGVGRGVKGSSSACGKDEETTKGWKIRGIGA